MNDLNRKHVVSVNTVENVNKTYVTNTGIYDVNDLHHIRVCNGSLHLHFNNSVSALFLFKRIVKYLNYKNLSCDDNVKYFKDGNVIIVSAIYLSFLDIAFVNCFNNFNNTFVDGEGI